MLRACRFAAMLLVLYPCAALAQDASTSFTRLLLGGGVSFRNAGAVTPTYAAGIEIKPAWSTLKFRLATEYWDASQSRASNDWYHNRSIGAHVLAIRPFGSRRARPYVMAGAGLYADAFSGISYRYTQLDSGYLRGTPYEFSRHDIAPALIWGAGLDVRILGMNVFGELRLPVYYRHALHIGPHAPVAFGVTF